MKKIMTVVALAAMLSGCTVVRNFHTIPEKVIDPEREHFITFVKHVQSNYNVTTNEVKQKAQFHMVQAGLNPVCDKGDCFLVRAGFSVRIEKTFVDIRYKGVYHKIYDVDAAADMIYNMS